MQPDRPTRGDDAVNAQHDGDEAAGTGSVKRRKEQSDTALSNVSQDYGGPDKQQRGGMDRASEHPHIRASSRWRRLKG